MISTDQAAEPIQTPSFPIGAGLRLRRFGLMREDLDIDFERRGPELVTEVLALCAIGSDGNGVDRRRVRELSLSNRTVCLLRLARMEGTESLSLGLRCVDSDCAQPFELDLEIDQVLAFAPVDAEAPFEVDIGGLKFRLRRPTANDQLAWLGAHFADVGSARTAILWSLVSSPPLDELLSEWEDMLEAAFDDHDPLVCFNLDVVCPFCRGSNKHELALGDLALRVLGAAQMRIIESVHQLASHYGWHERDVLALPHWRRQRYLACIESGI